MRKTIVYFLLGLALTHICVGEDQAILVVRHGEDVDDKATNGAGQYEGTLTDGIPTNPNNRPWYNEYHAGETFVYAGPPQQQCYVPYPDHWHDNVNDKWPVYFSHAPTNFLVIFGGASSMKYEDEVRAQLHGLSDQANAGNSNFTNPPLGEFQAEALASYLDAFVSNNLGCAPIARIFTKDISGDDYPTPNPFDTVYPYYKAHSNTTLYLSRTASDFTGGMFDVIKTNLFQTNTTNLPTLLASPGSAIICWDRQGIWGGSGKPISPDSLLCKLSDAFKVPTATISNLGQPPKAARIYAFIKRQSGTKELKVYDLVYSNTNGTKPDPAYSVQFKKVGEAVSSSSQ